VIRTYQAEQAHAVPAQSYMRAGLFDPALTHRERPVSLEEPVDEMGMPLPAPGATAQNSYRPERYLQCNLCGEIMPEADTATHTC